MRFLCVARNGLCHIRLHGRSKGRPDSLVNAILLQQPWSGLVLLLADAMSALSPPPPSSGDSRLGSPCLPELPDLPTESSSRPARETVGESSPSPTLGLLLYDDAFWNATGGYHLFSFSFLSSLLHITYILIQHIALENENMSTCYTNISGFGLGIREGPWKMQSTVAGSSYPCEICLGSHSSSRCYTFAYLFEHAVTGTFT